MQLKQGSYSSLIQGVSQQPAPTRFDGQAEEQINMSSDAVRGLCRRPPTNLIAWLLSLAGQEDWKFAFISLDDQHEYLLAYRQGEIRAFDSIDGGEVSVANSAPAYLTGAECSFVTINGVAFVADTSTVVEMDTTTFVTRRGNFNNYIIGQVLGAAWSRTYTINVKYRLKTDPVDGAWTSFEGSYTTPDGSAASHSTDTKTSSISNKLVVSLNAASTKFTFRQDRECFLGVPDSTIRECKVVYSDDNNNQNIAVYTNFCDNPDFIPVRAPRGYVMTVLGLGGTDKDDYYLTFVPNAEVLEEKNTTGLDFSYDPDPKTEIIEAGVWRECTQPDKQFRFDKTTMPHRLKLSDDKNSLIFELCPWEDRGAGDDDSNPVPSFVGYPIKDMAAFQGRLVCIAGSSIIMSRTNKPRDFWAKSATNVSDSDPIDMESSFKSGLELRRLALHNRDLVAFSKPAQLTVFGRNSLTPQNASIVVSTSFDADLNAAPVSSGSSVFFGVQYGQFSGVREFFTETSSDANNSESITNHCSQYIEGRIRRMAASSNFDMLVLTTDDEANAAYVYQFVQLGKDKAQAAWSKWELHAEPVFMHFRESELVMIMRIQTEDGWHYQMCEMSLDRVQDDGLNFQVHLDGKSKSVAVHTTLDVAEPLPERLVYVQGDGCPNPGMLAPVQSKAHVSGTYRVTFDQDMQGGTLITGVPYTSSWVPTRPYMKDQQGQPILSARMILRMFKLRFDKSGEFTADVLSEYNPDNEVVFSQRMIGDVHNIIGKEAVYSDFVSIPFRADPEYTKLRIKCSAHTPLYITQLQWSGQVNNRIAR